MFCIKYTKQLKVDIYINNVSFTINETIFHFLFFFKLVRCLVYNTQNNEIMIFFMKTKKMYEYNIYHTIICHFI